MDGLLYLLDMAGRMLAERDQRLTALEMKCEALKEELVMRAESSTNNPIDT